MHSKTLLASATFALCTVVVNSQDTANEPVIEASDIEAVVPNEIISPVEVLTTHSFVDPTHSADNL